MPLKRPTAWVERMPSSDSSGSMNFSNKSRNSASALCSAATASALLAVMAPSVYPFFDEEVAAQVPQLGPVAWTNGYYAKYAVALRERSAQLSERIGRAFTPVMVERALWAARGDSKRDVTG